MLANTHLFGPLGHVLNGRYLLTHILKLRQILHFGRALLACLKRLELGDVADFELVWVDPVAQLANVPGWAEKG